MVEMWGETWVPAPADLRAANDALKAKLAAAETDRLRAQLKSQTQRESRAAEVATAAKLKADMGGKITQLKAVGKERDRLVAELAGMRGELEVWHLASTPRTA